MSRSKLIQHSSLRILALAGLVLAAGTVTSAQGRGGGGAPAHAGGAGFAAPHSFAPPSHPMPAPLHPAPMTAAQGQPANRPEHSAAAPAQQLAADMKAINQTAFNDRKALLKDADMSLAANRDALKKIQSDARTMRADAREKFQAALADVKARDDDLTAAIKEAQNSDAPGWDKAREKLAAAHQHYLDAMARLAQVRHDGEAPTGS